MRSWSENVTKAYMDVRRGNIRNEASTCKGIAWVVGSAGQQRQCSLAQIKILVGMSGLEPETSSLSVRCSNQLSYMPKYISIADEIISNQHSAVKNQGFHKIQKNAR